MAAFSSAAFAVAAFSNAAFSLDGGATTQPIGSGSGAPRYFARRPKPVTPIEPLRPVLAPAARENDEALLLTVFH